MAAEAGCKQRIGVAFICLVICSCLTVDSTTIEASAEIFPCKNDQRWSLRDNLEDNNSILRATYFSDCNYRVRILANVINTGNILTEETYIKVYWASDARTGEKIIFYHPIVLSFKQSKPVLAYMLKHEKVVNNKAHEVVIHKDNTENYEGCDSSKSVYATCGMHHYPGSSKMDPDSSGFCCPCDKKPRNQPYHYRGGQKCSMESQDQPYGMYGARYWSSAHCLQFDSLWYSVNSLSTPGIQNSAVIHLLMENPLYEKLEGQPKWLDVMDGCQLEVGTDKTLEADSIHKILATFRPGEAQPGTVPLDPETQVLLMPDPSISNLEKRLQVKGSAEDFLVVDKDMISWDGTKCDKIGVLHSAFVSQNGRCDQEQQSCLQNQPYDLWLHDEEKEIYNKPGRYKLKNFGSVDADPLMRNNKTGERYLRFQLRENHTSEYTMEMVADELSFLRTGHNATITEVHIANSGAGGTIQVQIYNPGSLTALYSVRLRQCSSKLSISPNAENSSVSVGPQNVGTVKWNFRSGQPQMIAKNLACTVEVRSVQAESAVSTRLIAFKMASKCWCMSLCKCKCAQDIPTCEQEEAVWEDNLVTNLTPEMMHYHHLMLRIKLKKWQQYLGLACFLLLFLIFLGCCKALIGHYCSKQVAEFGLCLFLKRTRKRSGKMSKCAEITVNVLYCFYFPFTPIHYIVVLYQNQYKWPQDSSSEYLPLLAKRDLHEIMSDTDVDTDTLTPVVRKVVEENRSMILREYCRSKRIAEGQEISVQLSKEELEEMSSACDQLAESKTDVFMNFKGSTSALKNAGHTFSLCGKLKKVGEDYRFTLHVYKKQVLQNVDGELQPLSSKRKIPQKVFAKTMSTIEAHSYITEEPEFPCLNKIID